MSRRPGKLRRSRKIETSPELIDAPVEVGPIGSGDYSLTDAVPTIDEGVYLRAEANIQIELSHPRFPLKPLQLAGGVAQAPSSSDAKDTYRRWRHDSRRLQRRCFATGQLDAVVDQIKTCCEAKEGGDGIATDSRTHLQQVHLAVRGYEVAVERSIPILQPPPQVFQGSNQAGLHRRRKNARHAVTDCRDVGSRRGFPVQHETDGDLAVPDYALARALPSVDEPFENGAAVWTVSQTLRQSLVELGQAADDEDTFAS